MDIKITIPNKMYDEEFLEIFDFDGYEFEDNIYISNYGEVYNKTTNMLYSYEPSSVNLKIKPSSIRSISRWNLTLSAYKMENSEYEKRRANKKKEYGFKVQNKRIQVDKQYVLSALKQNEEREFENKKNISVTDIEILKLENQYLKMQTEYEKVKKDYEEKLKNIELLINQKKIEKENDNKYGHTYFYIIRPKYNNFYMYVGHTINFENRKYQHIEKTRHDGNTKLYNTIRDTGGWDNWEMIKIDEKNCTCKQDALKIEQDWCEKLRPNLNSKSPFT
jgi:hypothetical protein